MSALWIYLPELPHSAPSTCRINADEARHATASRRLRAGDAIHLFDGRGQVADAVLSVLNHNGSIDASVEAVRSVPRILPDIEIASAIPKGDRLTTLLESIAPLAASRFTPLQCTHSVVRWSQAIEMRAARVLIAACKQSHQPWIPEVNPEATPVYIARDAVARGRRVVIAVPGGAPLVPRAETGQPITMLVGPEGGFTQVEADAVLSLGGESISLGSSILRIELAVACGLARLRL